MSIADKLVQINNAKLAIRDAIEDKGVTVDDAPLDEYPEKIAAIESGSNYDLEPPADEPYVRPADWLALPAIGSTEEKIVGLVAVFDSSSNFIAFRVTVTGGYTVDWGDGSAPENVASGVTAQHNYVFTDLDSGTLTSRGYRQAIISVTRQNTANAITNINFDLKHNQSTLSNSTDGWLDIAIRAPSVTSLTVRSTNVARAFLERFEWQGNHSMTTGYCASLFSSLPALIEVVLPSNFATATTSTANMFDGCRALRKGPDLTLTNNTSCASMFNNCSSLRTVPAYSMPVCTNVNSMFNVCTSLTYLPVLTFGNVGTNIGSMLASCTSLQHIENLVFGTLTSANSLFSNLGRLRSVPPIAQFQQGTITNVTAMFNSCTSLVEVPAMIFGNVGANQSSMFSGCSSLKTIGELTFGTLTNMTNMFSGCTALIEVPVFTNGTSSVTTINNLFLNCTSLTEIPAMTFGNVGSAAASAFQSCHSVRTIGELTFAGITSTSSMFTACQSLLTVPTFTNGLAAVTSCASMFSSCLSLEEVPDLTFGNCAGSAAAMFTSSATIRRIGTLTFGSCTSLANMFNGCTSLQYIEGIVGAVPTASGMTNAFSSCTSLKAIPSGLDVSGVTTFTNPFGSCTALAKGRLEGTNATISYSGCALGPTELEDIFNGLSVSGAGKTITISGNWGASLLSAGQRAIATGKGWTISG